MAEPPLPDDSFDGIDAEALSGDSHRYLEAVLAVVCDLSVNIAEVEKIRRMQQQLELSDEELRAVHARIFQVMLERTRENGIDEAEQELLRRLHNCLGALGWAPGE